MQSPVQNSEGFERYRQEFGFVFDELSEKSVSLVKTEESKSGLGITRASDGFTANESSPIRPGGESLAVARLREAVAKLRQRDGSTDDRNDNHRTAERVKGRQNEETGGNPLSAFFRHSGRQEGRDQARMRLADADIDYSRGSGFEVPKSELQFLSKPDDDEAEIDFSRKGAGSLQNGFVHELGGTGRMPLTFEHDQLGSSDSSFGP
jgi:hypothetical protein